MQKAEVRDNRVLSQNMREILAGCFSGVLQVLVGQPFDIVKVRMQSQTNPISPIDLTRGIWHNEGPGAFYKGTMSPLAGVSAIVSIQFATNEIMKRFMIDINTRAKQENVY